MDISRAIREIRIEKGMTQERLARRAGISIMTIQSIDSGRVKKPRRETLEAIAKGLGVTVDYILQRAAAYDLPFVSISELAKRLVVSLPEEIPVVGELHAPGEVILPTEVLDRIYVPREVAMSKNLVGIKISGTCLEEAGIREGDVLIVDTSAPPDYGDIVLCYVDSANAPKLLKFSTGTDLRECKQFAVVIGVFRRYK